MTHMLLNQLSVFLVGVLRVGQVTFELFDSGAFQSVCIVKFFDDYDCNRFRRIAFEGPSPKMAAVIYMRYRYRRNIRSRCRILRDRTHPLEIFDDEKVYYGYKIPLQSASHLRAN